MMVNLNQYWQMRPGKRLKIVIYWLTYASTDTRTKKLNKFCVRDRKNSVILTLMLLYTSIMKSDQRRHVLILLLSVLTNDVKEEGDE